MVAAAQAQLARTVGELENPDLAGRKRVAVYALGAGLALMLEKFDPA